MNLSYIQINTPSGKVVPFAYRDYSEGDKGVIQQIFQNQDYNFSHWEQGRRLCHYYEQLTPKKTPLIIDAGANIGASVVYFSIVFPQSLIYAIEPNQANFEILQSNTAHISSKINFHGGLSNVDGDLFLMDPGASDWGFRTIKSDATLTNQKEKVAAISPDSILADPRLQNTEPLILKIDIEGAEADLFDGPSQWMDRFGLIIIELHDWLLPFSGSSRTFLKALTQHDFDFLYRGENIFLFNRRLLG